MKKVIVIIFVIFALLGCKNQKNNEVVIGAVLPLTGDVASYGVDSKDGIDLAIAIANATQSTYKFKVNYQDSKGDPKTAVNILQQMLTVNKPVAIIGGILSSTTAAMIPVAKQNNIVIISPAASAPNLTGISPYFFRVFPSDVEEGHFISDKIANENSDPQVCIVYVNNDYGNGLKDVFVKNSKSNGIKILGTYGIEKGSNDFRTVLAKIKTQEPNVIYLPTYYEEGGILIKQIAEMGIKAKLYGSSTLEDPKLLALAGNAAEGLEIPVSTGFNSKSSDSIVQTFIGNYTSKYNRAPGLVSALGYDSAEVLINGILKNGKTSDEIKKYLLETKNISGAAGIMNFDSKGDVHKPIILKKVINNKFETVK